MNNLQDDGWDLSNLKYIQLDEKGLDTYRLVPNDILFNRTNSKELVGKCEVFRESGDWVFASYLIRVRTNQSRLLPQFASDFLGAGIGRLQIDRFSRQIIGMTNINAEEIRELRIPLPSITEQEKLVATMDTARAERKAKLAEADALMAGIDDFLLEAIGVTLPPQDDRRVFAVRLGDVQERLDTSFHHPRYRQLADRLDTVPIAMHLLGDFLVSISSGATPHRNDSSLYTDSGVKFLRILNVVDGEVVDVDMKYITDAVHSGELARSRLSADDVLMTITGRVGSAAVVMDEHLPANINQHIVRMRIDAERCLPTFLCEWLNSTGGLELSNRSVSGGTRVALDYKAIRNIRVPLPPIAEQERLVALIVTKRNEARRLRAEAKAGWQAAKHWFEEQLLGAAPP